LSAKEQKQRLVITYTQESRRKRLQEAYIEKDLEEISRIRNEVRMFKVLKLKPKIKRGGFAQEHKSIPRQIFLCITQLERTYKNIDETTLLNALFIFDCSKEDVWKQPNKWKDSRFDAKYLNFDKEFLELLSFKEEAGLVFWFRPSKSYAKVSDWLAKVSDPMHKDGARYEPLQLEASWWWRLSQSVAWKGEQYYGERQPEARFVREIGPITRNFEESSFDFACTAELLVQSNPSLDIYPWCGVVHDVVEKKLTAKDVYDFEVGSEAAAVLIQSISRGKSSRKNSISGLADSGFIAIDTEDLQE
jgi:hypothetical protein